MTARWWEALLGSVDQKRRYRQYKARIDALPEPYREAAQAFDRYFMHFLSITEGEDKPVKYPVLFQTAQVVVVTKTDIAEAVDFRRDAAVSNIRRVSPQAVVIELSARTGHGMDKWYEYLEKNLLAERTRRNA